MTLLETKSATSGCRQSGQNLLVVFIGESYKSGMKSRFFCWFAFSLLFVSSVHADVRLPKIFGNHMVLQQGQPLPVWGWADPGKSVTVSFAGQEKSVTADEAGSWKLSLDALDSSAEGRDFVVTGSNTITLADVLVGEVWVCSGQSNMAWSVRQAAQPGEEAKAAKFPLIRHIKIPNVAQPFPVDDVNANWQVCSPETVSNFTAVGYFFGRELHQQLDVPIGLVNSSWGGTRIEPWTPPVGFEMIKKDEGADFATGILKTIEARDPTSETGRQQFSAVIERAKAWVADAEQKLESGDYPPTPPNFSVFQGNAGQPTHLYNGLVHPLVPYGIKGAIWYQGESNGSEGESYFHKKRALIGGWRSVWEQGEFPFYHVQLANFRPDQKQPGSGDGYARIRDAQKQSLAIPNTGMAVIIDIGEANDIHPKNKQDVGKRLAQWALAKDYGKDIVPSGPLYAKYTVEGNEVTIQFDHPGSGLIVGKKAGLDPVKEVKDGKLERFAIAGEDKKFHWADAVIDGDRVVVSCPEVPNPVAVRYAFSGNPEGANLYNREGLPASPFRTDDW